MIGYVLVGIITFLLGVVVGIFGLFAAVMQFTDRGKKKETKVYENVATSFRDREHYDLEFSRSDANNQ